MPFSLLAGSTGTALGVVPDITLEQSRVNLAPGDALVLYTDGVTDAQGLDRVPFGRDRLLHAAQSAQGRSAQEIQELLLAAIHRYVGDAPQFDDITLLVLARPLPGASSGAQEQEEGR